MYILRSAALLFPRRYNCQLEWFLGFDSHDSQKPLLEAVALGITCGERSICAVLRPSHKVYLGVHNHLFLRETLPYGTTTVQLQSTNI